MADCRKTACLAQPPVTSDCCMYSGEESGHGGFPRHCFTVDVWELTDSLLRRGGKAASIQIGPRRAASVTWCEWCVARTGQTRDTACGWARFGSAVVPWPPLPHQRLRLTRVPSTEVFVKRLYLGRKDLKESNNIMNLSIIRELRLWAAAGCLHVLYLPPHRSIRTVDILLRAVRLEQNHSE